MEPSDVTDILANAARAVKDANVPDELKGSAFEKAIDMLAGRISPAAPVPQPAVASSAAPASPSQSGSLLDRLAARLRLDREAVDAVFTENGEEIAVTVPPDKLAKARSAGTREIALLVAAAGQATGDEPTAGDEIRRVAEDYDRFDGPNNAATLADMKGTFLIGGTSRARTYRLTKPGWAAATTLIARLGGADRAVA